MSRRPAGLLLADTLERIDRAELYLADVSREAFLQDTKTSDSVVRNLEVIGEAANRLPESFRTQHAEIPWRQIIGLRNRIIHDT